MIGSAAVITDSRWRVASTSSIQVEREHHLCDNKRQAISVAERARKTNRNVDQKSLSTSEIVLNLTGIRVKVRAVSNGVMNIGYNLSVKVLWDKKCPTETLILVGFLNG